MKPCLLQFFIIFFFFARKKVIVKCKMICLVKKLVMLLLASAKVKTTMAVPGIRTDCSAGLWSGGWSCCGGREGA